jgi:hypothetical protein
MPTDDTPSKPSKRLAPFLDGAWNTVSSNTNVWRAKSMCAKAGDYGVPQTVYYDCGCLKKQYCMVYPSEDLSMSTPTSSTHRLKTASRSSREAHTKSSSSATLLSGYWRAP